MRGDELEPHDVELLTSTSLAHLATVMPDGSPQVSPVWIDASDSLILVNTAEGRLKLENVRRDPRVALSITNESEPLDRIMVRGRVVEITHDGADEHIDKLVQRYWGRERFGRYEPKRVLLKIEPEMISRSRD